MQYMGGKTRLARHLAPILRAARGDRYVEPFLGSASMFAAVAGYYRHAAAGDVVPDLILMWQAAQRGWIPPDTLTREQYDELRAATPSPLRAFAGFGCSYGGKWFGGYAANRRGDPFAAMAARSISRKVAAFRHARIELADYSSWQIGPRDVVYCDPPYTGATGYRGAPRWDAGRFWQTAEGWAIGGADVYVSERAAPAGWRPVWSQPLNNILRADTNVNPAIERLWRWQP